jgi:ribose transport system permease protein
MQPVSEQLSQKKAPFGASATDQRPRQAAAKPGRLSEEIKKILLRNEVGVVLMLAVICIVTAMLTPRFLTADNLMNVLQQSVLVGILSLGQLLVIVTAGIDLSVGSILALASAIFALGLHRWGLPEPVAFAAGLGAGVFLGFTNGMVLTRLRMPHPFISTMAMMTVARGAVLILMNQTPISGMPDSLVVVGQGRIGAIPISFGLMIVIYIAVHLLLNRTRLGRYIYAIGGNKEAARIAGINVSNVLVLVYSLSGLMCILAGFVLAGRVNAVFPLAGFGSEFDTIAAVIIGGASFFGGVGTVWGTLGGVLIMSVLHNALNLLGVDSNLQQIAIGLVIVGAMYLDVIRRRVSGIRA